MKTMFTLSELATTLEQRDRTKADFIVPTTALAMRDDATLAFTGNDGSAPIGRIGHKQIGEYTNVPAAYYERMRAADPALLAHNVNRWLRDKPAADRRMVRTLDGNVSALLSERYQRIDYAEVAEVALNVLSKQPGLKVVSCAVTEERLYIKAVSTEIVLKVPGSKRVGDLVEAGVAISTSEVGMGAVKIAPFAHFLVCTNGMVRDGVMRKAHVGRKVDADIEGLLSDGTRRLEDEVVLRKIRDVMNAAFDRAAFQRFMDQLGATTQQHITGDVVAAVEALGPAVGLLQSERQSVLRHLIEGGDLSRYGLCNAVTRTAEDVESYDRATEIETIGYRMIQLPTSDWNAISLARPLSIAA